MRRFSIKKTGNTNQEAKCVIKYTDTSPPRVHVKIFNSKIGQNKK